MNKAVIGGVVALGILGALVMDLRGKETRGLANAHRAAGFEPSCEAIEAGGNTWAVCEYAGAPSAWIQIGDDWATANGKARQVVDRLEQKGPGPYQDLPNLVIGNGSPSMPAAVLERLQ
ncbi:hypothetical protein [Pseudomonas asiatica]|uniref:hypothetical protein n=1 Tax=Pseudomonas asiatica TaxID=2219225 RepID=UPI001E4432AE|nr:hypothetical protein [Pseudomonas asiatica]MDM3878073.1 hypothetical protein [Pseudomonas asiatica]